MATEWETLPDNLHNTTTMDPIQQKRKSINRGEAPLLRRAAVIGYGDIAKGMGRIEQGRFDGQNCFNG